MKNVFYGAQLLLLAAITVFIFLALEPEIGRGFDRITDAADPEHNALPSEHSDERDLRRADLRRIMEQPLRAVFKFPESVKFRDVQFRYTPILETAGAQIGDLSQELEFAEMCGLYAAKNGLGAYGRFEPFYTRIAADNTQKALTGMAMFETDGELRKLLSLDTNLTLDGDSDEFEKHWDRLCGSLDSLNLGSFAGYEIGYGAFGISSVAAHIDQITDNSEFRAYLAQCKQDEFPLGSCLWTFSCLSYGTGDPEACQPMREMCTTSDSAKKCNKKLIALRDNE